MGFQDEGLEGLGFRRQEGLGITRGIQCVNSFYFGS